MQMSVPVSGLPLAAAPASPGNGAQEDGCDR